MVSETNKKTPRPFLFGHNGARGLCCVSGNHRRDLYDNSYNLEYFFSRCWYLKIYIIFYFGHNYNLTRDAGSGERCYRFSNAVSQFSTETASVKNESNATGCISFGAKYLQMWLTA